MRAMQSFLMFFYILDQCYDYCCESDLGGFLGAISPELWDGGQPMDKAIFLDWQKISQPSTVNEYNIVKKTYNFMNYYEKRFGFKFTMTKQWLLTLNDKSIIEKAVLKTQEMYKKYDYIN